MSQIKKLEGEEQKVDQSSDNNVDLVKYTLKPRELAFSYEEVFLDCAYEGPFSKKKIEEKLEGLSQVLDVQEYDHKDQKMNGRAALLLIMKRTGTSSRTVVNSKQLLELLTGKNKVEQLKSQIIEDIEKRFADLNL